MPDSTPIIRGDENVAHGSGGIVQDAALAEVIIESISFTDVGEDIEELGNTGHTKIQILTNNGWD
jgi:hypothetical protein